MNRHTTAHLEYDQLLKALVDPSDLGDAARHHLEDCTGCQQQVRRLVQRYDRLGQMAKKMAPQPTQAFRLPEHQPSRRLWKFNPAVALGLVGALIFVFTVWWPQHIETTDPSVPAVAQYSEGTDLVDDPLMDEIDQLVADALPAAYQELASMSEAQSIEDLIEWVVPSIEEEDELDPRA